MTAAESANVKVIGVDVDQSSESDTVITSVMKQLSTKTFPGIIANDHITLQVEKERFILFQVKIVLVNLH